MSEEYDPILEKASREATDWLIRLQEDSGGHETGRAFAAWLTTSPANAAAWAEMQYVSDGFAEIEPARRERWLAFAQRARAEKAGREKRRARAAFAWRWPRLEGAVAAVFCMALFAGAFLIEKSGADHKTGAAEVRTVMLDDGSAVTLAPQSAMDVSINVQERHVRLVYGTAYFNVAADAARPFRVEAGDAVATVLGTGFEIRQDGNEAEISVEHGRVRAAYVRAQASAGQILARGETARVSTTGDIIRGERPPWRIAAWRDGRLIAEDTAVGALVDELRRYYSGKIIIADKAFADLPVTGVYDLNDPAAALKAIAGAQNGRIRRITPWFIIISPSPDSVKKQVNADIARPAAG